MLDARIDLVKKIFHINVSECFSQLDAFFLFSLKTKRTICQSSTWFYKRMYPETLYKPIRRLESTWWSWSQHCFAVSRPPIWSTAMLLLAEVGPSDTHISYYEKMKLSMFFEVHWRFCDWSWPFEGLSGYCDRYRTTIFQKEQLLIVLWDWESSWAEEWLLAAGALEVIRTSYLVFQLINSDMLKFGVVVVGFLN